MNLLERYGPVVQSKVNPDLPCVVTPSKELNARLDAVRLELPPGLVAFIGAYSEECRIGAGPIIWYREIVVGPGQDQWAILGLAGTRCNTGYDLMATLRDYHQRYGIDIRLAEYNILEFKLLTLPEDVPAFVDELYDFCPDPVDIGFTQCKDFWAEIIQEHQTVGLWWQGV